MPACSCRLPLRSGGRAFVRTCRRFFPTPRSRADHSVGRRAPRTISAERTVAARAAPRGIAARIVTALYLGSLDVQGPQQRRGAEHGRCNGDAGAGVLGNPQAAELRAEHRADSMTYAWATSPPAQEKSPSCCPPQSRSARPRSHGRAGSSHARVRGSSAAAARTRPARSSGRGGPRSIGNKIKRDSHICAKPGVRYSLSIVASSKYGRTPRGYDALSWAETPPKDPGLRWR